MSLSKIRVCSFELNSHTDRGRVQSAFGDDEVPHARACTAVYVRLFPRERYSLVAL